MIATVTYNPAVDYTVSVDESLTAGAVGRASEHRYDAGGKGINVSKFLAALDVETVATGPVGGFVGRFLSQSLAAAGVQTDLVTIDETTRLNTTLHAPDGEFKVNQRGPTLGDEHVSELLAVLTEHDPDVVVVAGSLPPGLEAGVVDRLATGGDWETVVDVGGDLLTALEASYALCKPNREELAAATGSSIRSVDEAVAAARRLREAGFDRVLASLGADGAVLVGPDDAVVRDPPDVTVVDTVGAGDAMLAGYLAAAAAGATQPAAVDRGTQVAAAVLGEPGPTLPDSVPLDGQ